MHKEKISQILICFTCDALIHCVFMEEQMWEVHHLCPVPCVFIFTHHAQRVDYKTVVRDSQLTKRQQNWDTGTGGVCGAM